MGYAPQTLNRKRPGEQTREELTVHDKRIKAANGRASGFSLVEMLIVVAVIGVIAGMAMYSIVGALPNIKVNNGLNVAVGVVKKG